MLKIWNISIPNEINHPIKFASQNIQQSDVNSVNSLAWSPDGMVIAYGMLADPYLYYFDGRRAPVMPCYWGSDITTMVWPNKSHQVFYPQLLRLPLFPLP